MKMVMAAEMEQLGGTFIACASHDVAAGSFARPVKPARRVACSVQYERARRSRSTSRRDTRTIEE